MKNGNIDVKNYVSDDFFDRIKNLIKSNSNLTIREYLASIGLNPETYYSLRTLKNFPRCDDAQKIADGLGVSLDYLVTGETKDSGISPYEDNVTDFLNGLMDLEEDQREMLLATFSAQVKYFQNLNRSKK